ncbi:hypothetical protein CEY15_02350 [Dietzia natronolimnaea]|uniref:Uncharacterized protein n=1 Tax=Dietzia natronolimnaea TaxID=161920 RepID=A0A2A2WTX7_9ACTN|nr:hypothetical protein CEY15_02350 [Dietzia natronolimnaea]
MAAPIHMEAHVSFATADESRVRFDELCRNHMRMSTDDFLALWDAGEFDGADWDAVPGLRAVAMALPMVRS